MGYTSHMHQMFTHAAATGWKEHDQAIHWGWWQHSPKWDLGVEPSAMDLISPGMSWAEIRVIYNGVYQLWRSPRRSPCDEEIGERIHQEVQDSVKECLLHRQVSAQLEEELKWSPTGTSKMDIQAKFQARTHATYDHFKKMLWDSCKEAIAMVRDAHWWALVAMALLEENIKWLGHFVTHGQSGSHQCLGSHRCSGSCRRSQLAGHWKQVPSAASCNGDSVKRHTHLSNPSQPRQWVTFAESSPERIQQCRSFCHQPWPQRISSQSQLVEGDLRCPLPLTHSWRTSLEERCPHLEWKGEIVFSRNQCLNSPSINSSEWVMWQVDQVDTPTWWLELSMVPRERDVTEFTRKVWALN